MIVLDEQLGDPRIMTPIESWYPGRVINVRDLRPHVRLLKRCRAALKTPRSAPASTTRWSSRSNAWRASERARAAGAVILAEPEDQFYGDRTYRARDPEGHVWTFGQTVRYVPETEWEAASGLKVAKSL